MSSDCEVLVGVGGSSKGQGLRDTERVDTASGWRSGKAVCASVPHHEHPAMGHLLRKREGVPCVRLVGPGRRCYLELVQAVVPLPAEEGSWGFLTVLMGSCPGWARSSGLSSKVMCTKYSRC